MIIALLIIIDDNARAVEILIDGQFSSPVIIRYLRKIVTIKLSNTVAVTLCISLDVRYAVLNIGNIRVRIFHFIANHRDYPVETFCTLLYSIRKKRKRPPSTKGRGIFIHRNDPRNALRLLLRKITRR